MVASPRCRCSGLTRFLGGLLYETKPLDIPTFPGMSGLLFIVGLSAAYLPPAKPPA